MTIDDWSDGIQFTVFSFFFTFESETGRGLRRHYFRRLFLAGGL